MRRFSARLTSQKPSRIVKIRSAMQSWLAFVPRPNTDRGTYAPRSLSMSEISQPLST